MWHEGTLCIYYWYTLLHTAIYSGILRSGHIGHIWRIDIVPCMAQCLPSVSPHPLLAQKVVTRSARAAVSKIGADALHGF